jgi:hypothetical protein
MSQGHHKTAGILVYLIEELGDARLRCEQLKRYIGQAMHLVEQSEQKSHIHEVAGDLLYGIPDVLFRLDKALDATALAASRMDYEELKQELRPEKVNELEQVLKDVRIRRFDRRAEGDTMNKFATGTDVANALRRVASAIEADEKQGLNPSASKIANTLLDIAKHVAGEETLRARFEEGKPADPTDNMSEADANKWRVEHLKNKDNFKGAASGDPRWITAKYPGKTSDGTPFKKGDLVLYYPNTKTFLAGDKAKAEWRKFEDAVQDEDVYNSGKYASDEHEARFEEGKPADPTDNMSPEDAKEWKAQTEENKDNFKTAASDAKVSTFFAILSSYLTQQDQKEDKRNPNIYRLGLFLKAMQEAEDKLHKYLDRDDSEAMDAMKAVLSRAFNSNFPPLKKILKQIDEWQTHQKLPKLNKI